MREQLAQGGITLWRSQFVGARECQHVGFRSTRLECARIEQRVKQCFEQRSEQRIKHCNIGRRKPGVATAHQIAPGRQRRRRRD